MGHVGLDILLKMTFESVSVLLASLQFVVILYEEGLEIEVLLGVLLGTDVPEILRVVKDLEESVVDKVSQVAGEVQLEIQEDLHHFLLDENGRVGHQPLLQKNVHELIVRDVVEQFSLPYLLLGRIEVDKELDVLPDPGNQVSLGVIQYQEDVNEGIDHCEQRVVSLMPALVLDDLVQQDDRGFVGLLVLQLKAVLNMANK